MTRNQYLALGWAFVAGCGAHEPPRALTTRELANVTSFANALGYVRFFHPTEAAVHVNWDAFAVRGIRTVQGATSADSLASALMSVFAPITSNVVFATTGAPLPTTIPKPADATHVVFWRHLGVGTPNGATTHAPNSPYESERVVAALTQVGQPVSLPTDYPGVPSSLPPVPDPSRPMIATLGGGVSMSMPIGLFTPSESIDDTERRPNPSWVVERFRPTDRATRLAAVVLAWSVFRHFYPYFDVVRTDWPAALDAALRTAAMDENEDAFRATLERLLAALHDGHGFIRPATPSAIPPSPDVRFGWGEGRVLVTAVGDSARASGLTVGDEVVAVNGRPIEAHLAEQATRISGATPQWIRAMALRDLAGGLHCVGQCAPSARAQLRVRKPNGLTRDVSLSRTAKVTVKPQMDSIAEVSHGVYYVDLGRVTDATLDTVLPLFHNAKAVILDARGRVRPSLRSVLAHLSDSVMYTPRIMMPVITMPDYKDVGFVDRSWTIAPAAPRLTGRLIFLSHGGNVSGDETMLGMVEGNRLGDIVGEPTAGTNGVVNPFVVPGGYELMWTGMLVRKRDGTPHHGLGVIPTVAVSPTVAGVRAGRDEVLERAVSLLTTRGAP